MIWIDWAKKKADWYDPTIARKDKLFGERNHEENEPSAGVIHHSDRGIQYCSNKYQDFLSENKMICSMSRKGNCMIMPAQKPFLEQ